MGRRESPRPLDRAARGARAGRGTSPTRGDDPAAGARVLGASPPGCGGACEGAAPSRLPGPAVPLRPHLSGPAPISAADPGLLSLPKTLHPSPLGHPERRSRSRSPLRCRLLHEHGTLVQRRRRSAQERARLEPGHRYLILDARYEKVRHGGQVVFGSERDRPVDRGARARGHPVGLRWG